MCILIFTPAGTTVPADHLARACKANPDGFGYAIIGDDNALYTDWSMDAATLIDSFTKARAMYPNGHAMFHARIATHGTVDLENCHPFWIGEHGAVLGHNGIMPHVPTDGKRSDTRVFAEDWLPTLGLSILDNEADRKELGKFIGYSKLVILSVDDQLQRDWYIVNEHYGDWDKGVWYSNESYLPSRPRWQPSGGWQGHGGGLWVPTTSASSLTDDVLFDDEFDWDDVKLFGDEYIETCQFCDAPFVASPSTDMSCPDCGHCAVCQSWNCPSEGVHPNYRHSVDELVDWDNADFYQIASGEILLWDTTLSGWRSANAEEYFAYEMWLNEKNGVIK